MSYLLSLRSKWLAFIPLMAALLLLFAAACGDEDTATPRSTSTTAAPTSTTAAPTSTTAAPTSTTAAPTSTPSRHGGIINTLGPGTPAKWDPHQGAGLDSIAGVSPLYNQLLEFNPIKPSEIQGDLAKSWTASSNGLSYTFVIHDDVKWSDGTALTAEDVAFSVNRMFEPDALRPYVGLLGGFTENAEVVSANTVKINLKFPSAAFASFLAADFMKIVPKHIVEAGIDINDWENIVGSGPFLPKSHSRGESWEHEKNPNYFKDGLPYLNGLRMTNITDAGTAAAAFRTGQLDYRYPAGALTVEDALKLEEELVGKVSLYFQPSNTNLYMMANVENEPWDDLRIINALRLATDQVELQQGIGSGKYAVGAPFPVGSWYGSTVDELAQRPGYGGLPGSPRTKADDIADAVALLKEAGYDPPSELGKIEVLGTQAIWFVDMAQLWAQQMRRNLGLDMEVKVVDFQTGINAVIAGEFEMAVWGNAFNVNDPDDHVVAVYGPGDRNYTRWKNPDFLDLLDRQSKEQDPDARLKILRDMEEMLFNEDPYIQLEWFPGFYLVRDTIKTAAGAFVPAETQQTALKQEHLWLEQ
jgi:peptide/nickel transport system substrate-binding protein